MPLRAAAPRPPSPSTCNTVPILTVPPPNRHALARDHGRRRRDLTSCKTASAETAYRRREAPPPRRPGTKPHRSRRRHVAGQARHFVGNLALAIALPQEHRFDPPNGGGSARTVPPRTAGAKPTWLSPGTNSGESRADVRRSWPRPRTACPRPRPFGPGSGARLAPSRGRIAGSRPRHPPPPPPKATSRTSPSSAGTVAAMPRHRRRTEHASARAAPPPTAPASRRTTHARVLVEDILDRPREYLVLEVAKRKPVDRLVVFLQRSPVAAHGPPVPLRIHLVAVAHGALLLSSARNLASYD
nr:formin-like protein 16 [Lolium perenne]